MQSTPSCTPASRDHFSLRDTPHPSSAWRDRMHRNSIRSLYNQVWMDGSVRRSMRAYNEVCDQGLQRGWCLVPGRSCAASPTLESPGRAERGLPPDANRRALSQILHSTKEVIRLYQRQVRCSLRSLSGRVYTWSGGQCVCWSKGACVPPPTFGCTQLARDENMWGS